MWLRATRLLDLLLVGVLGALAVGAVVVVVG